MARIRMSRRIMFSLELYFDRTTLKSDFPRCVPELCLELTAHLHTRSGCKAQAERFPRVVPGHLDAGPFAFAIVERAAIILIKEECRVTAGMNHDFRGLVGLLAG